MFLTRQTFTKLGLFFTAIALTTACNKTVENPPVVNTPPTNNNVTEQNPVEESTEPRVYWLKDEGDRLVLAPENATPVMDTPNNQLRKLVDQLLENQPKDQVSSAIPEGTKLLNLVIQPDGIVVNLSAEFTSGGGSASMIGRVAQVLYTVTSTDLAAPVWFQVEGKPLEVLGGEGLEIAQPMTRKIFTENFEL